MSGLFLFSEEFHVGRFAIMSRTGTFTAWISCFCCALLYGSAAFGQETESEEYQGLEIITVTAQKREENLLDVPLSISAFTNNMLQDIGASELADFLQTAPGVGIIDDQSGTQLIQIRGINSTYGNALVGYYLDELPFTLIGNTQVPDVRTYDLERVEVLRGPQGTLYGDGSIGGTIRILTKNPVLDQFQAGGEVDGIATAHGDSSWAAKGMLNVPFAKDTLGLRIVATQEDFGGWVDNTTTGTDDQNSRDITNLRTKLTYAPTEELDVTLAWWHTKQDVDAGAASLPDLTTPLDVEATGTDYDLYSLTINYDFKYFDLISASSWMNYSDSYDSLFFAAPFTIDNGTDAFSQEIRLTSNTEGMFRWTGGFFYRSLDQNTYLNLEAFPIVQDITQKSDSWAVFGEGTWTMLDDKLDFTLGLRYFEDDRSYTEVLDPFLVDLIKDLYPDWTGTSTPKFDSTNPRFNIAYRTSEDWMVYTNIAKGFRTGQAQPLISLALGALGGIELPLGIDPETLWSYEVGTKGTMADGRVSVEAAVFYNDWKDQQVVAVVNQSPRVAALVNGGTAESTGFELAISAAPMDGLLLQFTGNYVNAEYTETVPGTGIVDGDNIAQVPKVTLFGGATYRWPWTETLGGFINGNVQYTSERTDPVNLARPSDAMTLFDMRFGLEWDDWSAYLWGDNLTDEDGAIEAAAFDGQIALRPRPRSFGITLRYAYN
jgi:outer membrane receptor protein involved in Fe transport